MPDLPGLRPSGDRSRETLFNWLQANIPGATCVDLFAGSGVLGLEAASRGAADVTLIEKSRSAAHVIRKSLQKLDAGQVRIVQADAIEWLAASEPRSLDIVFIDPPFSSGLHRRAIEMLSTGDCVRKGGLVYLETPREMPSPAPPPGWEISREKLLGEVRMQLLKKI